MERSGWKTNVEISPNCPRCGSCNTKFCYYNNYSLTQPRYFCKSCTRYWTKGGSLRNVPVGGGCRKSRRGKSIRVSTRQARSRVLPHNHDEHPMTETSSIDLMQVYANFLNQSQEPETRIWVPHQLPNNDSSCHHFSSSSNMQVALNSHGLFENGCFRGGDITDRYLEMQLSYGAVMNFCGPDDGLPPLPGEEGLQLPHTGWLNYEEVIVPNTPQLTRVESKAPYSADELIDNKSSFDMSSYETLFRS